MRVDEKLAAAEKQMHASARAAAYVSNFGTKKRRVEPPAGPAKLPHVNLNDLPGDIHDRIRENLDCREYTNMCLATRKCDQWKRALRAHEFDTNVAYEPVGATENMCTRSGGTDDDCMRFAAMCKQRKQAIYAVSNDPLALRDLPTHLRKDREVVLAAIAKHGGDLLYADDELRNDKDFVREAVKKAAASHDKEAVWIAIADATEAVKGDTGFMKEMIEAYPEHAKKILAVSRGLRDNEGVVTKAVRNAPKAIELASFRLRDNSEFMKELLNPFTLGYASDRLKNDRDFVNAVLEKHPSSLRYASATLRADQSVVLAAVKQNGLALKHASPSMQNNEEVVLAAVEQNGLALEFAGLELRLDPNLALAAVKQNGLALEFVYYEIEDYQKVVLAAVKQNGLALDHALQHTATWSNKEVALAAVKQNGLALQFAHHKLKGDSDVVLAAVKQNGLALKHAPFDLRKNKKVALTAVKQNGLALRHASPKMRNNEHVVRAAVANNEHAWDFAGPGGGEQRTRVGLRRSRQRRHT